jgi:hypothetical protein
MGSFPNMPKESWVHGFMVAFRETPLLKSVNVLALWILLLAVFCIMIGFHPTELPPPWFDEGWTLSVAKNWAEHGVYALRLEDRWISPEAMVLPFTVVLPAGISLRLFGIGVLQARLPGMLFTLGTLALLYLLAERLYNTRVAWGTLFVVLLLAPVADYHPIWFGRQALGEMPMLCLLLAGYWFWLQSLEKPGKYMIFAAVFWGLGVITKRQVLPFWILSWIVPVFVALVLRQWQILKVTLATGVLTGIAVIGFTYLDSSLYRDWPLYGSSIVKDLYTLFFVVWIKDVRNFALFNVAWYGGFSFLGLLYATVSVGLKFAAPHKVDNEHWGALSLVTLVLSWMTWFAFGSLGWLRYFAPIFVIGAMFFAKLIHDYTGGYNIEYVAKNLAKGLSWRPKPRFDKARMQSLLAIVLVIYSLFTVTVTWACRFPAASHEVYLVSEYINSNTPRDALIETYDSELLFLLDRQYHYPPPEVQTKVNLRVFLKQDLPLENGGSSAFPLSVLFPDPNKQAISISYDDYKPLEADPDYIVVGPFGDFSELYDPLLDSDEFFLIREYPNYSIYERVRE